MLYLVAWVPTLIYVYLAWVTIPILLLRSGWISIIAFFTLFNTAYYFVVNAVWFKSITGVALEPMDVIWAFQEALDVAIIVLLLRLYRSTTDESQLKEMLSKQVVTFVLFIASCAWISFAVLG